jgi:hypothetical protein
MSPGLADGETAARRLRHELQFDPFAALLEVAESLPAVLRVLTAFPCTHPLPIPCGAATASFWRTDPFGVAEGKLRPPPRVPVWHTSPNKKGATWRPRLLDIKLSLYF